MQSYLEHDPANQSRDSRTNSGLSVKITMPRFLIVSRDSYDNDSQKIVENRYNKLPGQLFNNLFTSLIIPDLPCIFA